MAPLGSYLPDDMQLCVYLSLLTVGNHIYDNYTAKNKSCNTILHYFK